MLCWPASAQQQWPPPCQRQGRQGAPPPLSNAAQLDVFCHQGATKCIPTHTHSCLAAADILWYKWPCSDPRPACVPEQCLLEKQSRADGTCPCWPASVLSDAAIHLRIQQQHKSALNMSSRGHPCRVICPMRRCCRALQVEGIIAHPPREPNSAAGGHDPGHQQRCCIA